MTQFPHQQDLKEMFLEMYDYEKFSCPFRRGDHYFYFHNTGLQPQSVLYKKSDLAGSEPSVFFDPKVWATDGTAALSTYGFSESGNYFAYGLSNSGSDWVTIGVQDEDRNLLKDKVEWVKFSSIEWTHDDKGFFYKVGPPEKSWYAS